jgi:pyridoxamine 5'-phosphate oxidase
MALQDLRQDYDANPLNPDDLAPCPFDQFQSWFIDAQRAAVVEPNAFTLATVDAQGQPQARTLLLKGIDPPPPPDQDAGDPVGDDADEPVAPPPPRGLVFFTNYASDKGRALEDNPRCAMNFWWGRLARCVRVAGRAEKISPQQTADYFQTRPRGSQLGAWCSDQSSVIPDRQTLTTRYAELEERYPDDTPIPVPPTWGGYRVVPLEFEFWQGQPSRLHDRLRYRPADAAGWVIDRLSP